ncbi:MAG: hypothetical protein, partial [Olavius algarvensis Gamma 1 endosymbiont]
MRAAAPGPIERIMFSGYEIPGIMWAFIVIRVSPCSGCETGHPSPPFALRSGDNLYVPRTP